MDEDELYLKVQIQVDAILVPNVALFQYFKLPQNLEGNLELIMQILSNNLDTIFNKMQVPEVKIVKEVQIPRIYDS